MSEFLKLKKSNCKNCYKCIRHCPVKSIRFSGNQANIVGNECILCGQCFVVCPQNAKEIADETERVKVLIDSGAPVIASVAPSFIANYDGVGFEELKAALQKLGFADAEETAVGATIVKREYERLLNEDERNILISSCCHSVNLLIQKYYPSCLPYLADVLSPMQAHCKDIKRRYPDAKTVFIGPCVAKKDEADYYTGITDAVLTYEELTEWFEAAGIVPEKKLDKTEESLARFFPTTGGILKTMQKNMRPDYTYLAVDGVENCMAALHDIEEGNLERCFIEMSACAGSCIGGPVMEKYHRMPVRDYYAVSHYAGKKDFIVSQPDPFTLRKEMEYIGRKLPYPSESEIREALRRLEQEHIIEESGKGSVVIGINEKDLEDIFMIRKSLECQVAALAAKNRTEEQLKQLREALEFQEFYLNKKDPDQIKLMDSRFHETLYKLSGSTAFYDTLVPLHKKIQKYRRASVANSSRAEASVAEHRKIYEAIEAKNTALAAKYASEHVENAYKHIMRKD